MAIEFKDYYAILGLPRTASEDDIKKAFRKLARKYHPDVAKDKKAGEVKFKEINEANEVLSDPQKRKLYDELGPNWQDEAAAQRNAQPRRSSTSQTYSGAGRDFNFGGGGGEFSDFFEQIFGQMGRSQYSPQGTPSGNQVFGQAPRPQPGSDLESEVQITLEEAMHGAVREVSLQRRNSQTGQADTHNFKIHIPAGVHDGQVIRVPGKGGEGEGGAGAGHLFLRVLLAPHPQFRLEGSDVYYDLNLAPWDAVLGTSVRIPTPHGEVNVRVPAGTNNGQRLRVRKHGIGKEKSKEWGDFYAVVTLQVPKFLSSEERKLWEELKKISSFDPRQREQSPEQPINL